jgi:MFS family permease
MAVQARAAAVPFGALVETGMIEPGAMLTDAKRRWQATVGADGSLELRGRRARSTRSAPPLQGAPSCNGWTFWRACRPSRRPAAQLRQIGVAAPVMLVVLRLLQGLALGGEYGGAATYVAEHAPDGKRGLYTSWIQTTATLGLFAALLVVLGTRVALGEEAFAAWGWRIPFLVSIVLLGVSLWIRLQLEREPGLPAMKAEGTTSKAPLKEAFGKWPNLKLVLIALFGARRRPGGGLVHRPVLRAVLPRADAEGGRRHRQHPDRHRAALATPFFIFFGWLSDRIGRKPIILAGCAARGAHLLPAVPGAHALRQPGARAAQATRR